MAGVNPLPANYANKVVVINMVYAVMGKYFIRGKLKGIPILGYKLFIDIVSAVYNKEIFTE